MLTRPTLPPLASAIWGYYKSETEHTHSVPLTKINYPNGDSDCSLAESALKQNTTKQKIRIINTDMLVIWERNLKNKRNYVLNLANYVFQRKNGHVTQQQTHTVISEHYKYHLSLPSVCISNPLSCFVYSIKISLARKVWQRYLEDSEDVHQTSIVVTFVMLVQLLFWNSF